MRLENIAVIPDGNRRYARKYHLPLKVAYSKGFEKVNQILEWASEASVKRMSFWALSLENYKKRSPLELRALFGLMKNKMLEALATPEFEQRGARISFFGKLELLPENILRLARELEENSSHRKKFGLQIGIAYSGQDEIMHASKQLAKELASGRMSEKKLDEMGAVDFSKYLYTSIQPDLVIRTGGVHRLSGFLPFQSAYSEYYFSPRLWPEFSRSDFEKAVEHFESAERRFGK